MLSDVSTVTGIIGAGIAFIPGLQGAAAVLSSISVGTGLASAVAYGLGGDGADAEGALAGTALSILTGGFGKAGERLVPSRVPDMVKGLMTDGPGALIDESGKQAAAIAGRTWSAATDGAGKLAKTMLSLTGNLPGGASMAFAFTAPLYDQGPSQW